MTENEKEKAEVIENFEMMISIYQKMIHMYEETLDEIKNLDHEGADFVEILTIKVQRMNAKLKQFVGDLK